jgi:hypothetical protein
MSYSCKQIFCPICKSEAFQHKNLKVVNGVVVHSTAWVECSDQDCKANVSSYDTDYDKQCRREQAMELGMGLGINAYNDYYGY